MRTQVADEPKDGDSRRLEEDLPEETLEATPAEIPGYWEGVEAAQEDHYLEGS